MDNYYLQEQLARHRHEADLARAEHARLMAENGLDLLSVLRRAVAQLLARVRLFERPVTGDLTLVSRAKLERRVERAA